MRNRSFCSEARICCKLASRSHRSRLRFARLNGEPLETRSMLAVTTALTGGNLAIVGDGVNDNIAVVGSLDGTITVTGKSDADGNPTLINGVANGAAVIDSVFGDLSI